jgi:hypothetical protein
MRGYKERVPFSGRPRGGAVAPTELVLCHLQFLQLHQTLGLSRASLF